MSIPTIKPEKNMRGVVEESRAYRFHSFVGGFLEVVTKNKWEKLD